MKKARFITRVLVAVFALAPTIARADGPEIPPPPTGGLSGILEFLMGLFMAIINFLQAIFGSLPGLPG
jgi:hypothetical protein